MSKQHALAGIIGERQRQVIHAVVDEYLTSRTGIKIGELMPVVNRAAAILIHEVVSGHGGLTGERVIGEKGRSVARRSSKAKYFDPGAYQEFIPFHERDLLLLRKLGTLGDRGMAGVTDSELNELNKAAEKLALRIANRMDKLSWDALFTGKYTHKGIEFDFGVPLANTIAAATDWSDKNAGTPFDDLETIINQNPLTRKYKFKEMVLNSKSGADIRKSVSTNRFITNANVNRNDINELKGFIAPGLPDIHEERDSYQSESLGSEGEIILGNAEFFVPDDKLLLVPDFSRQDFSQYGEMQVTENMNDPAATADTPAQGIYLFTDEEGLKDRQSPNLKVVGGFNGAPNLMRPDDTLTVTF